MHDYFSPIVGHEPVLGLLRHALDRPGQAYLFHGPNGAGKRTVARAFSSALLNLEAGRSLEAHPDFVRLARAEGAKQILVDEARELVARMSLSAAMGGRKVALVEGAECLNLSAVNALLKAVEEPPKNVIYIFITEQPSSLPATLRSRLAPIVFGRLPVQQLASWLEARGLEASLAGKTATAAVGLPGEALRLISDLDQAVANQANWEELLHVLREASLGRRIAALEALAKNCESQADPEAEWRNQLAGLMRQVFKTGTPADQARVAEGLIFAWRFVGSALSPRLGLEWTAVRPYSIGDHLIPSFLLPTYL